MVVADRFVYSIDYPAGSSSQDKVEHVTGLQSKLVVSGKLGRTWALDGVGLRFGIRLSARFSKQSKMPKLGPRVTGLKGVLRGH